MRIVAAHWSPRVNWLAVACDCGATLAHWSNVDLCRCPWCGRAEWWNASAAQYPELGPRFKVMEQLPAP